MASQLALSPSTVRNDLSNAIGKVGGRNRIDAIRIATSASWLQSRATPAAKPSYRHIGGNEST